MWSPNRCIDVGQWLVSGLQRPSSVRQSLAVRQKELSEEHRMTLKRQKCIENKQNLCNFPFFLISFSLFSIFPSFFFIFFLFFFAFFLYFSLSKCTTEMDCTTKWAFNWRPWRPAPYVDASRCLVGVFCVPMNRFSSLSNGQFVSSFHATKTLP